MAQTVLGGIGAGIGFLYGGPTGAQYGWMIGSAVGGVIDPQVIQGPRIGEIAQQTSQEGVPRPIIFGLSPPITGNIIATGEPIIVKRKESQGKGGPKVETESVFRTYAIRVCEGPIHAFVRIWRNGILVYDTLNNSLDPGFVIPLFGGHVVPSQNAAFVEKARFFLGDLEQQPSPDLEVLFGVGTTPAHQGTAYMVMADEDLTDLRGAIPQWTFQVGRGFEIEFVREVFFDDTTWTVPSGVTSVDVVVVAGGGGGGTAGGSGGGGGGGHVVALNYPVVPGASINVVVADTVGPELKGGNSSFGAIVAEGGGKGGHGASEQGGSGGCGGGGSGRGDGALGGSGSQGQSGGAGVNLGSLTRAGGGGGGATQSGENAWTAGHPEYGPAGKGGAGVYLGHITGDDLGETGYFCGGGGGGGSQTSFVANAPGGIGGGASAGGDSDVNNDDHTGGGGGGPDGPGSSSANQHGRSGVVVIRYGGTSAQDFTYPLSEVVAELCDRAGLPRDKINVSQL